LSGTIPLQHQLTNEERTLKKILLATAIAASTISAPFATAAEGDWSNDLTKNWKERCTLK